MSDWNKAEEGSYPREGIIVEFNVPKLDTFDVKGNSFNMGRFFGYLGFNEQTGKTVWYTTDIEEITDVAYWRYPTPLPDKDTI